MAEIRFNYGDKFTQTTDTNTGIGSTIPAGKLDVAGGTSAGSLRVSGIATLSSYQGFVNTKLTTNTEDFIVEAGQSGSVSGEVVGSTGQTITVSTGATTGQGGVHSLKVFETFMPPVGGTADRPTDVKPGMVYYNKDFKTIEFWDGNFWKQVDNTTTRGRGFAFGGYDVPTAYSTIRFVEIATQGNAQNFGDLSATTRMGAAFGNATRGIHGCLYPSNIANLDYITIASGGDAIDWGADRTSAQQMASLASSTRGIFAGGASSNVIKFIEISTTGNCTDFVDLTTARRNTGGFASPTRGVISAGGEFPHSNHKTTDFITVASKGNATDAGDLIGEISGVTTCSNHTRGIFMGGYNPVGSIDDISFMTTASLGNSIDFGNLTTIRREGSCVSNQTRAVYIGGNQSWPDTGFTNVIQFITIATGGDATDFGDDLLSASQIGGGCSDSYGGLGGF